MAMAMSRLQLRAHSFRSILGIAHRACVHPLPPPSPPPPPLPLPFLLPNPRSFANPSGGDHELLRILREEIEHERQTDAVSNREAKNPPKPFTIDDKPGAQEVFLYRTYNKEDISIACVFQAQSYPQVVDEDGNESEDPPTQLVQMIIKVSKGGDDPFLELQCVTNGDEPVIDRVSYKEVATGVKDLPYEGPQFSDLDENVQTGFQKYLIARGIDAELGSYLLTYMYHKEQREYSRWLRNVEDFVKK